MSTTTDTSTERQASAAHFAYGAIHSLLDGDPSAEFMRAVLREVEAELRNAGVGEGQ